MATNTWKKIKNKFKWKKANSRSRKASRRKKKQNIANTANMIAVPKRPKKKATKSNIFGCLTNAPKEYKQCNIEPNYPTYPTSTNSTVTTKSKSSERNNSIQHTNQIICINNDNNNIDDDDNNNNNDIVPFRPISPSKTETSKKFIIDNVSNVSVSCLSNNAEIKYNMTPTPQTFTLADNDYLYRNDIDIYEGVLEVENDTIIEEYAYGDAEYDYGYDFEQFAFEFDADKTSNNINNDSLIDLKQKRESVELELLINDKQFINQLNMELNEYGYDNPQQLLQQVWDQQIQIDRNHQIVEILECLNNNINNNNNEYMEEPKEKEEKQEKVKERVEVKEKEPERENRKESDEDDDIICDGEIFHNKYMVGHKINEGGFGSVWQIIDNNLYSKCVKIMDLGDKNTSNYEAQIRRRKACVREYNMTLKAFSDEVIEVELFIDNIHFVQSPKAYLIMPYFNGKDLFEFIDDEDYFKKVSVQTMLHIFYKIAEKLYDLHYFKKIVHGDIKPENVMILKNNNNIEVEIIDYGIAKSIRNLSSDTTYLKSKGHFGTKGYVAPELMTCSKYNRKIDVFSSGVVLYNMVTECCLFPKGYKYYRLPQCDYYKYLKKKFKCIKKRKKIIDILYSCLAFDPDERLDVKQLIQRYFHSKS